MRLVLQPVRSAATLGRVVLWYHASWQQALARQRRIVRYEISRPLAGAPQRCAETGKEGVKCTAIVLLHDRCPDRIQPLEDGNRPDQQLAPPIASRIGNKTSRTSPRSNQRRPPCSPLANFALVSGLWRAEGVLRQRAV